MDQQQQIINEQKEIIRNQELMLHNDGFFEHFTDHLIIAFSGLFLGFLACSYLILYLYKNRVRVDYDIEEGSIMRVEKSNGKKMLVVRFANLTQLYDVILLALFDKGKGKFISQHDVRRIRIIRNVLLVLGILTVVSGIILIFSALPQDINIFNYLFK
jgi:hypothetical protein